MDSLFVSYIRCSTDSQGRSGLGLEAQQREVARYLTGVGGKLLNEYVEVESAKGVNPKRPQLQAALKRAKETGATLCVAKLDRISRNLAFVANLLEAEVPFVCADSPDKKRFQIQIEAAFAEEELARIRARTKAGLQSIKERIARDGSYVARSGRTITRLGTGSPSTGGDLTAANAAKTRAADVFASEKGQTIADLRTKGLTLRQIADTLTGLNIKTSRGSAVWTAMAVKRVLDRAA